MEVAKFILTAVGTFISVFALSFTIFQYWRKKQDEKFDLLKAAVKNGIQDEEEARKDALSHLEKRVEYLEHRVVQAFENRLSTIEGELRGIKPILQAIQNWFINNTPGGK
ncbi:hypothetical protein AGMMS49942_12940 [Spirochaetia bacterium]|nr:hypothetical protein AGMMS49942_12940 [Spirochaetia bacterium]